MDGVKVTTLKEEGLQVGGLVLSMLQSLFKGTTYAKRCVDMITAAGHTSGMIVAETSGS